TQYYNFFDVEADCELKSVKVYADGAGDRTLYIEDENDAVVYSQTFTIPDGESRVTLNWELTPGTGYKFRVVEGNHGLWRDDNAAEISYPYNINDLVSITGANTSQPRYYYYFYDWEVEGGSLECVSDREEVVVSIGTVGVEEGELIDAKVYPNPTSDFLNISIPTTVEGNIDLKIMDVAGNLIQSSSITAGQNQLNVSGLAKGVYLLEMNTNKGLFSRRIIVE
ncbi:MAG: T9SS type A sorting domain-containing protein, partial [Flavobacteriales bacterium]